MFPVARSFVTSASGSLARVGALLANLCYLAAIVSACSFARLLCRGSLLPALMGKQELNCNKIGLRDRNSPICTMSQNGYGEKIISLWTDASMITCGIRALGASFSLSLSRLGSRALVLLDSRARSHRLCCSLHLLVLFCFSLLSSLGTYAGAAGGGDDVRLVTMASATTTTTTATTTTTTTTMMMTAAMPAMLMIGRRQWRFDGDADAGAGSKPASNNI